MTYSIIAAKKRPSIKGLLSDIGFVLVAVVFKMD